MRVLALDTTTAGGSAALVEEAHVLAEAAGNPARPLAGQLPALLLDLLQRSGLTPRDVDWFAVASGPGSFTGLRIGIATIQGLATVTGKRVIAISALEVLAHLASRGLPAGAEVAAWMDARRSEVFTAAYRVAEGADFTRRRLQALERPSVGSASETLLRWDGLGVSPSVYAGDGAVAYAAAIGGKGRILAVPALAAAIGLIGVQEARLGFDVDPGAVLPLYVRRPDAEIARDRQQSLG